MPGLEPYASFLLEILDYLVCCKVPATEYDLDGQLVIPFLMVYGAELIEVKHSTPVSIMMNGEHYDSRTLTLASKTIVESCNEIRPVRIQQPSRKSKSRQPHIVRRKLVKDGLDGALRFLSASPGIAEGSLNPPGAVL